MTWLKKTKYLFLRILLISLISILSFQSKTFSMTVDQSQDQSPNNLVETSTLALSSYDEGRESKLTRSEKGVKRINIEYDQNDMDSLSEKDSPGLSAVEFKYDTRASVKNVNYLLDSETARTLKLTVEKRDSILLSNNEVMMTLITSIAEMQLSNNRLKYQRQIKLRKERQLKAVAHLIFPIFLLWSTIFFGIARRVDLELLSYFSLGGIVLGVLGTLFYFADFVWLLTS